MHPYVPHLLEDIIKAHKPKGFRPSKAKPKNFEEEMQEVEDYVSGKNEDSRQPFSFFCGLKPEDFPPSEQLSGNEMEKIAAAFKDMAESWNLLISVPNNYPAPMKYKLMTDFLNERVFIPRDGAFWGFDNCTGNPEGCFFGEYCSCLKNWNDDN